MTNIKTILFDLDGTLLPLDRDGFEKAYIGSFAKYNSPYIDPKALIHALMSATDTMISNKEKTQVNEVRFFEAFGNYMDQSTFDDLYKVMGEYYETHFDVAKEATDYSQAMVDAVSYLKDKGFNVILATNPLFPKVATDKRIAWAGFTPEDFMDVTRFEENHFCKPQIEYYKEIMEDNNLDPQECLMVGNDVEEDLIAAQLGMKTALLTDDLIHRDTDKEIQADWIGTRVEFLEKIKEWF